jgi:hypothetical protein
MCSELGGGRITRRQSPTCVWKKSGGQAQMAHFPRFGGLGVDCYCDVQGGRSHAAHAVNAARG